MTNLEWGLKKGRYRERKKKKGRDRDKKDEIYITISILVSQHIVLLL